MYVVADDSELPADIRAFVVERDIAGLFAALSAAVVNIAPLWIELTLDRERAAKLVELWQLDPSAVHVDMPRNRFAAPRALLDMPLPQADERMARMFERQCRELLESRLSHVGAAGVVRSRLRYNVGELPSMQTVADELHIDPRTLRRRLAGEGTSFRQLLEEVRRTLATELLADNELSVEDVARRLGYAETANFTHAFKRWHSVAPSHFRKS